MPRTRLINPEFFLHEGLGNCSAHARLLFIALWTQADRLGRLRWLPLRIHGETFPHEPEVDVPALAAELVRVGSLQIYSDEGRAFAHVTGFTRWQNPHRNESASKIPEPPDDDGGASFSLLGRGGSTNGQPMVNQGSTSGAPDTSYQLLVTSSQLPVTSRPLTGFPRDDVSETSSPGRKARGSGSLALPTGDELLDFLIETWGKLLGKHDTLPRWLSSARGAYPGIDLLGEARRAHAWEEANPSRRKKQIRAFLSRWWTKAQDRGGSRPTTTTDSDSEGREALEVARSLGADL